jgi:ABC-type uncharacterized transport system ATPase component
MAYNPNQSRIDALNKKLDGLKKDLEKYEKNLEEADVANIELIQVNEYYENIFRDAAYSHSTKIIAIESLELIGVKKIQSSIDDAYNGKTESSFTNSMKDTLESIQNKINKEKTNISDCQKKIFATETALSELGSPPIRVG